MREALTYDDVLLVPKRTFLSSRDEVDSSTRLSRHINLNIPFVSANMDTVTESSMAIAMALEGGIGIIHRFLSIEEQVQKVLRVKRSQSIIIENPYTCSLHSTLKDARVSMEANSINSLLVTMPDATLAGILTNRDIQFEHDVEKRVSELMTKRNDLITAKVGIALDEARKILQLNKIEKLPLVDDQFRLRGLITAKDMMKRETHTRAAKDSKGRLLVGAAIGVRDGFLERAEALMRAGCDVLVIDIAHGHADQTIKAITAIRENLGNVEIIAGNVATGEGAKDLIEAGADAIKVGVGPGTVCITRMVTGCGVPQLTAVMDVVHVAKEYDVPVIADGGIQKPGDVVKALAAGASSIMAGSLFAGTEESPGVAINKNGRKYKLYRGMASLDASLARQNREQEAKIRSPDKVVAEGVESMIPYKGSVKEILQQFLGGLKSGMSYCGAKTIAELQKNAEFVKITSAGLRESNAHDVDVIDK